MKVKALFLIAAIVNLMLCSCSKSSDAEADVVAIATVRVQTIGSRTTNPILDAYGTVGFPPEYLHSLNAAAEVRVDRVLVSSGESVHRGQIMVVVQPTANTSLELSKAQADLQFSTQELVRVTALRQQQLATNTELASARLAQENARAMMRNVEARLGNNNGEIQANRDGFVATVDAQQGDIVPAGGALLHIADHANLRLRLGVEPKDLPLIKENQLVSISAIYDAKVAAKGHVVKLVRQIDPQTRLAEALVDVDADSGLLPGSTVKAIIELGSTSNALVVPRSAVLYSEERAYVFIVKDGKAVQTWVKTGADSDKELEILSGLKQGDQVVVEGNYELEDGMQVKLVAAAIK